MRTSIRTMIAAGVLAATTGLGVDEISWAASSAPEDPWPEIADNVFKGRALEDGSGLIALDLPSRAEDAALVPLAARTTLPPGDARRLKTLTLIVDANPAPVAATFTVGPSAGVTSLATRVRIDSYTNVHAVAELTDGRLYVVKQYVKASGGCSAPALKNADEAKTSVGQMKFRQFAEFSDVAADAGGNRRREAQIMVRHPNNSGLQMDQLTHYYIPAYFVRELRIWQGEDLILAMEGGISISEDPNVRFDYVPTGAAFRAHAIDTDDHLFTGRWPAERSQM
jgi:sulfur-oxidizing protein SoxY